MLNRRNFLKRDLMAGAGMALIPEIVQAALTGNSSTEETAKIIFPDHAVILFQGDSITDNGRSRDNEDKVNDRSMLGNGYAMFTSAELLCNYPGKNLQIYNRGISGNKVYQLQERWEKDCLNLKPDVVSILIGVNDFWHTLSGNYDGTVEKYENDYRTLLSETKAKLPNVKFVIGEPFTIQGGSALNEKWYPAFDAYQAVAKKLAKEFNAVFVPYQSVFNKALEKAPVSYWGSDGVHTSLAGSILMKEAWIKGVTK